MYQATIERMSGDTPNVHEPGAKVIASKVTSYSQLAQLTTITIGP
jgi:hypothetical protein